MPDYVIERPTEITVAKIQTEMNAEIRRVMLERYGTSRYIADSGAKRIHSDEMGELYRAELENDEAVVMLKVINSTVELDGSRKEYWLRVPPDITIARQAVAWTFGMSADEYAEHLIAES